MNKRFAIGIPTINRFDLLKEALKKYAKDFRTTKIFIVDNGNQGINATDFGENIEVIVTEKNLGVAGSWNLLASKFFPEYEFGVFLNDDIYLGKDQVEINQMLHTLKRQGDFFVEPEYFSAFILPRYTFEKIGKFDETFFPAYFEDNDYLYRLQLAEFEVVRTPELRPREFVNSGSMKKDKSLAQGFMGNRDYYAKKWGGFPESETFTRPFNEPAPEPEKQAEPAADQQSEIGA